MEVPRLKEICFTLGVINVAMSVYLITARPWDYFLYHLIKNSFLLFNRYFLLSEKKEQFYLSEFCYVTNYLSFVYIIICLIKANDSDNSILVYLRYLLNPLGPMIFRILFVWSFGPVGASVAFFRNALVFHSPYHMGILATHMGPPLLCYSFRFYYKELEKSYQHTFHLNINENPDIYEGLISLLLLPIFFYTVVWLIPYYYYQFVLYARTIKDGGYRTMIHDLPQLKNAKDEEKPLRYCMYHFLLSSLTFTFSQVFWRSQIAATIYLIYLFLQCTWNGSTYYFEVFDNPFIEQKKKWKQEALTKKK